MDWASRRVLSWRLSNTLDASFCVEALEEALVRHGKPEIFNMEVHLSQAALLSNRPGPPQLAIGPACLDTTLSTRIASRHPT